MPAIAMPAIAPLPILDLEVSLGLGREVRVVRGGLIVVVAPFLVLVDGDLTRHLNRLAPLVSTAKMILSTVRVRPPSTVMREFGGSLEVSTTQGDGGGPTVIVAESAVLFQERVVR